MKNPVVLITINRPHLAKNVFIQIRKVKPPKLFLISDGPRKTKYAEDKLLIEKTRKIIKQVDWKCDVYTKFEEINLGCRRSVSEGLDWVFKKVDRAIILEDDCIPNISFFRFCEMLLDKYFEDKNVSMISGDNFFSYIPFQTSYAFSHHSLIWGWATWRRAWQNYRVVETSGLTHFMQRKRSYAKVMNIKRLNAIQKTLEGKIDTWDYIWQLAMLNMDGLCVVPACNLVSNNGFSHDATHTKFKTFHSKLNSTTMKFPLKHPVTINVMDKFESEMAKTYSLQFLIMDIFKNFLLR